MAAAPPILYDPSFADKVSSLAKLGASTHMAGKD